MALGKGRSQFQEEEMGKDHILELHGCWNFAWGGDMRLRVKSTTEPIKLKYYS